MSLLDIVNDALAAISLPVLSAVSGSQNPTAVRVLRLAQEEVESLRSRNSWSDLISEATLTPSGVADSIATYNLPADFQRFAPFGGEPYDVGRNFAMGGPSRVGPWQRERQFPGTVAGQWRKMGTTIKVMGAGLSDTLRVEYVSSHPVRDINGAAKAKFTADSDVPRMPENLVKLGIKWRFLRHAGLDYAEALSDYEREFERACNEDSGGSSIILLESPGLVWGGVPDSSLGPF